MDILEVVSMIGHQVFGYVEFDETIKHRLQFVL